MYQDQMLWIAQGDKKVYLRPEMANRHGLITGASGTGKTVTLKVIAEAFSDMGVPVFLQDVKGDVSGMCAPGADSPKMQERISRFGIENWEYKAYPTRFWDIFGEKGHPVRITISDMGPTLISRLLGLSDVQESVLNMIFRIADDKGLLLIDLKDLRAMLRYVGDNKEDFITEYGSVSTQSIGAIQRELLGLETAGGDMFFGEPALQISDWIRTDEKGRGYINILHSVRLVQEPLLYATFLLWMLSELFETLPEVGDLDKPRMVFFFDEAHMLFQDAPKPLLNKIVQVVKLVRSKGVGVYFVTQNPADVPDEVLAQLSNRVQHALRAYTPAEQKAVRAAATAFRPNPAFDTETVITELATGEALVSFLDEGGSPSIVERAFILPPQSSMAPADEATINKLILISEFEMKYRQMYDRESAHEMIEDLEEEEAAEAAQGLDTKNMQAFEKQQAKEMEELQKLQEKELRRQQKQEEAAQKKRQRSMETIAGNVLSTAGREATKSLFGGSGSSKNIAKNTAKSLTGSVGRELGKSIMRGLLGSRR